jgi:hypothetical protein
VGGGLAILQPNGKAQARSHGSNAPRRLHLDFSHGERFQEVLVLLSIQYQYARLSQTLRLFGASIDKTR